MDRETVEHYGWIVVVLILGLTLMIMSSPLSNYLYTSIRANTVKEIMENRDVNADNTTIITPVTHYYITYDTNGGSWEGNHITQFVSGTDTRLPTNIYRQGYEFAGWESSHTIKNGIIIDASVASNISVKAKWVSTQYNISYNLGGGKFTDDSTIPLHYKVGTSVKLPTNLVRDGYTFKGWYYANSSTKITRISGVTGDQVVYAKWTKN